MTKNQEQKTGPKMCKDCVSYHKRTATSGMCNKAQGYVTGKGTCIVSPKVKRYL